MFRWVNTWIKRRKKAVAFEAAVHVEDVDGMIKVTYPDSKTQSVVWANLESIEVHTNDSGPWGADVWWVLEDQNGRCEYPQGATGEAELVPKFQSLEGFNNDELIRAMGCTSNREFSCWTKKNAT